MSTSLVNTRIKDTFGDLLQIGNSGQGITPAPRRVYDGFGNPTMMSVSGAPASDAGIVWQIDSGDDNDPSAFVDGGGNFIIGSGALALSSTTGFLQIATCPGQPTGVPTNYTGRVPVVFDTVGQKIWVYSGGNWISLTGTIGTAPSVTSFSPIQGVIATSVVITGGNFTGATAVSFGGIPCVTFTVNSNTQITAVVPVGAISGQIAVTNPNGTGQSSANFTVLASAPTLTSFTPTSGTTGDTIVITGTNFTGTTIVTFGGTNAASFIVNSNTQISAVLGGGTSGTVAVTTPAGTASLAGFTFIPPVPSITSFSPASGPIGTQIIITGMNFVNVISVSIGGASAGFTVNSITQITAVVDSSSVTGLLHIVTAGGSANSATNFTVSGGSAPTITSFIPTTAPQGTPVFITGTNLTGATIVTFGGTNAASFTVNSATQITAMVGASGTTGSIAVTTPAGSVSHAGFTFSSGVYQAEFLTSSHNTGSAETDLQSYTVPDGTLFNDGDYLRYDANGTFANPSRLRGYAAGGEIMFDTGVVGTTGQAWTVRMELKYRHPIAGECQVTVTVNAVQIISQLVTIIGSATNWAPHAAEGPQIPQVFKITGTGTSTSDVTAIQGLISRFSVGTPATLVMSEQFAGTPGASISGRTPIPTAPSTGDTWHVCTSPVVGQYVFRSNGTELTCNNYSADSSSCYIDVGVANFDVSLDVDSDADEKNGLAFRLVDDTHYMWFNSASNSNHAVGKEDNGNSFGGFFGQPALNPVTSDSNTQFGVLHTFRVVCYGPNIIFFCNGLRLFLGNNIRGVLNTHFQTATKIGLNQYGGENPQQIGDTHFDNLLVYSVPTVTPGVAMTVVNDTMADTNGTSITNHVIDIPYWGVWIVADSGTFTLPTYSITSNKVKLTSTPAGVAIAVTNSHYYDGQISAIINLSTLGSRQGLTVRADLAFPYNHYRICLRSGALDILEVIGNVSTLKQTVALTVNPNTDYLLACKFSGNTLTATVDGAHTCQYTNATLNQVSPYHGLNSGAPNEATYRNILITNNPT